ncbi:helix-turn-helix transcriptional regulator [Herbiconiux sp. VKM Ac-2851]|uniref:helix-turn-helix domain-containing protein n=1 Tax=Herbiconiux sp. VKM Ac-2851 TaxID=2739025 RepID=UPI0015659EA7|nr:helix-turn-helix transcriptional regulator [Herbiconiux sp. VKM Ac-2851]NQX36485.1 helix-turn-helix transcriptional regulator [Herbiconiux sp. VKM Ac-2851]
MPIVINLDVELAKKKMSVSDLAAAVGITVANISILKNGRAKAVRFSTLDAICRVLGCQPGDILSYAEGSAGDGDTDETGSRR